MNNPTHNVSDPTPVAVNPFQVPATAGTPRPSATSNSADAAGPSLPSRATTSKARSAARPASRSRAGADKGASSAAEQPAVAAATGRSGSHLTHKDPVTGSIVPGLMPFAPISAHRELAKRLVTSPLMLAADRRLTEDLADVVAFAVSQPLALRLALESAEKMVVQTGSTYIDALGSLHGGDHASLRHVTLPNTGMYSSVASGADNPRDVPHDDTTGTGSDLGRRPLLTARDSGPGIFAVTQEVPGANPIEHLSARQREELKRVMPTVATRSIRDLTSAGQRVAVDCVPGMYVDCNNGVIARQVKLREGHGRTSVAQNAVEIFMQHAGIAPGDVVKVGLMAVKDQWAVQQALHTALTRARAALMSSTEPVVEFSSLRNKVVRVPREVIIAALHGFVIRADITVAAFLLDPAADADLTHSLQRRYESRHSEQEPLTQGADLVGVANHVLDDLAKAGAFDPLLPILVDFEAAWVADTMPDAPMAVVVDGDVTAAATSPSTASTSTAAPVAGDDTAGVDEVSDDEVAGEGVVEGGPVAATGQEFASDCTGADIARWISAPQARPDWVPLWWLPQVTQWVFTRTTSATKQVLTRHRLHDTNSPAAAAQRARVAAHLVRRALPATDKTFDTAASQSILKNINGAWLPTARGVADLVDAVLADDADSKAAMAELQGRALVALVASGVLQGAFGAQETKVERGQANKFVRSMLTHKSPARRAHGRRTVEAAVRIYWTSLGAVKPPQVAEATPPTGKRFVALAEPLTDAYLRKNFGTKNDTSTGASVTMLTVDVEESFSEVEKKFSELLTRQAQTGDAVDPAWKALFMARVGSFIGSVQGLA